MRIIQIAPEIGPGTGVAGVAYALEQEWLSAGLEVARFTMAEAHGDWIPDGSGAIGRKVSLLLKVAWFSSVGTITARRLLRREPSAVGICHNDALVGDVYVNHGILEEAMRARGNHLLRMLRNPLHVMTWLRDKWRYGAHGPHRLVVNLSSQDDASLRRRHAHLRAPTTVIGNGVDVQRFRPSSTAERAAARAQLALPPDHVVVAFVGHEFDRKGLGPLTESLALAPDQVHLVVIGGSADLIARARTHATRVGVAGRIRFVGRVDDPRPILAAADLLALPSAYEAHALVVLEALASGLAVVVTPTGGATDVVVDGKNGWFVEATPDSIAEALRAYTRSDPGSVRRAARETAERQTWSSVAGRYLSELAEIRPGPASRP